jgi:hypothetical protein
MMSTRKNVKNTIRQFMAEKQLKQHRQQQKGSRATFRPPPSSSGAVNKPTAVANATNRDQMQPAAKKPKGNKNAAVPTYNIVSDAEDASAAPVAIEAFAAASPVCWFGGARTMDSVDGGTTGCVEFTLTGWLTRSRRNRTFSSANC